MPSTSEPRYVSLGGGLTLPLEPVLLVLDLEARGLTIGRQADVIVVRPAGHLTAEDRAALTRWRAHILALIDHADREAIA